MLSNDGNNSANISVEVNEAARNIGNLRISTAHSAAENTTQVILDSLKGSVSLQERIIAFQEERLQKSKTSSPTSPIPDQYESISQQLNSNLPLSLNSQLLNYHPKDSAENSSVNSQAPKSRDFYQNLHQSFVSTDSGAANINGLISAHINETVNKSEPNTPPQDFSKSPLALGHSNSNNSNSNNNQTIRSLSDMAIPVTHQQRPVVPMTNTMTCSRFDQLPRNSNSDPVLNNSCERIATQSSQTSSNVSPRNTPALGHLASSPANLLHPNSSRVPPSVAPQMNARGPPRLFRQPYGASRGLHSKGLKTEPPKSAASAAKLRRVNRLREQAPSLMLKDDPLGIGSSSTGSTNGVFSGFTGILDAENGSLTFTGKASVHSHGVDFLSGRSFKISTTDLKVLEELGRGNYGTVSKALHIPSGVILAMKEVRLALEDSKFRQILMELDVLHKCNSPFIVDFFGAFFIEGAVYMCIEYMNGGSLDQVYEGGLDEKKLAYITECVVRGLKELKDEHNIIHRDVKPTNILVNADGKVKLCDFGVSGNLVASKAKTHIGCQPYMPPERIYSKMPDSSYTVQSDVWSLGISMIETATGVFPYKSTDSVFGQLNQIINEDPPSFPANYSNSAKNFIKKCLNKNPDQRATYTELLEHPWLVENRKHKEEMEKDFADFVSKKVHETEKEKEKEKEKQFDQLNETIQRDEDRLKRSSSLRKN